MNLSKFLSKRIEVLFKNVLISLISQTFLCPLTLYYLIPYEIDMNLSLDYQNKFKNIILT